MDTQLQSLRRAAHVSGDYSDLEPVLARLGICLIPQVRYTVDFGFPTDLHGTASCMWVWQGVHTTIWQEDLKDGLLRIKSTVLTCLDNLIEPAYPPAPPGFLRVAGAYNYRLKDNPLQIPVVGDKLVQAGRQTSLDVGLDNEVVATLLHTEHRYLEIAKELLNR